MSVFLFLFFIFLAAASSKEFVPVLLWGTQTTGDAFPVTPALVKLTTNEFQDYLLKRVKLENLLVLAFVEENLSPEDFSWRDLNGIGAYPHISNLTKLADDVSFILSVHEPFRALRKLKHYGYVWKRYEKEDLKSLKDGKKVVLEVKLDEPDYLEDRPDMLKRHDEQIAKLYNEALSYNPNVMVVYTGTHSSWIDAELGRFKREEKEEPSAESALIITDEKNVVRMACTLPIIFEDFQKSRETAKTVEIRKFLGVPTINTKDELIMTVRFPLENYTREAASVAFRFTSRPTEWWTLNSADIQDWKETNLKPSVDVGAPSNHSYFCNPTVTFSNDKFSFTFKNFQVQPAVGRNSFGPVLHCVPFFSIAIWSGLVIVFILTAVLAWGITMIMDINTNDRFDDPKGKTITITATD